MSGVKKYNLLYSKKVFVGKSSIHGYGVIAKKDLKKGEIVFIIKGKVVYLEIKNQEMALAGSNWIGIGRNTWIDPTNYGVYLNHSSNPTCGIKGSVTVCAIRNIKKGEEITIDYSITEEQEMWFMYNHEINGTIIKVKSIQFLDKEKFNSYLPYIPTYFKKIYLKHHNTK